MCSHHNGKLVIVVLFTNWKQNSCLPLTSDKAWVYHKCSQLKCSSMPRLGSDIPALEGNRDSRHDLRHQPRSSWLWSMKHWPFKIRNFMNRSISRIRKIPVSVVFRYRLSLQLNILRSQSHRTKSARRNISHLTKQAYTPPSLSNHQQTTNQFNICKVHSGSFSVRAF